MTQIKCRTSITSLIGALLISSMVTGCTTPSHETNTASASVTHQTPLSVLYAGSMTHVMENEIRPAANAALHIDFQGEGAGSAELAHMITAKVANPDVFISASPS